MGPTLWNHVCSCHEHDSESLHKPALEEAASLLIGLQSSCVIEQLCKSDYKALKQLRKVYTNFGARPAKPLQRKVAPKARVIAAGCLRRIGIGMRPRAGTLECTALKRAWLGRRDLVERLELLRATLYRIVLMTHRAIPLCDIYRLTQRK